MANDLILPPECAAPPPSFVVGAVSDDDGCSICLEPFSRRDPRAVTECTHGYHLQCILEWSQRSKECPICSRQLVLKDSASQEMLAAVEFEGNTTSIICNTPEVCEANSPVDVGASHVDDSDFQERILQHPSDVTNRGCSGNSRRRRMSSRVGEVKVVPSFPVGASSSMHLVTQKPVNEFGNGVSSRTTGKPSLENPHKISSPEFLDLPESIKSKLFSASSSLRYKETFSKNTQGFKQKLLAQNKELGREVQREMSASIAGLAKMVQRLDLSSKKGGVSGPPYSYALGTSNFRQKGISQKGTIIPQLHDVYNWDSTSIRSSNMTPLFSNIIPTQP